MTTMLKSYTRDCNDIKRDFKKGESALKREKQHYYVVTVIMVFKQHYCAVDGHFGGFLDANCYIWNGQEWGPAVQHRKR